MKKIIFSFLFIVFCLLFLGYTPVFAYPVYPIKELGFCRNARECYLYCEIPENSPSCWSWGKYVYGQPEVLGDQTVNITYPIDTLGFCSSAQSCYEYCQIDKNKEACLTFAQKNGLIKTTVKPESVSQTVLNAAKTELGCETTDDCMNLCNQTANIDKCLTFAKKYKIEKTESAETKALAEKALKYSKKELGCTTREECTAFCNQPDNQSKCQSFVDKYQLYLENKNESLKKNTELLKTAMTVLGCTSIDSCREFCSKPANYGKCLTLMKPSEISKEATKSPTLKTTSATGAAGLKSLSQQENVLPKGCNTEEECKTYCAAHPSECPGFPSISITPRTAITTLPTTTPNPTATSSLMNTPLPKTTTIIQGPPQPTVTTAY